MNTRIALIAARFWTKVSAGPDCWLWKSARSSGYGSMVFRLDGQRYFRAHRIAWMLLHGPIPKGMLVCHTCDTPGCVRPNHLFLGTHAQNMLDMARKGRRKNIGRGEANGRAKLTENDVREIRASQLNGLQLANKYGITNGVIYKIRLRRSWRHI